MVTSALHSHRVSAPLSPNENMSPIVHHCLLLSLFTRDFSFLGALARCGVLRSSVQSRARSPRVGHVSLCMPHNTAQVFSRHLSNLCLTRASSSEPSLLFLLSCGALTWVRQPAQNTQATKFGTITWILCERLRSKMKTVETGCHSHLVGLRCSRFFSSVRQLGSVVVHGGGCPVRSCRVICFGASRVGLDRARPPHATLLFTKSKAGPGEAWHAKICRHTLPELRTSVRQREREQNEKGRCFGAAWLSDPKWPRSTCIHPSVRWCVPLYFHTSCSIQKDPKMFPGFTKTGS